MAKNTGKPFENLVAEVYEALASDPRYVKVERNVFLDSPDGPRQFDVVLRANQLGLDLLTVIECRDHNKKLNVSAVDGLDSKMQGVAAHKGVLVTRVGFTGGAQKKARRRGISLFVLHEPGRSLPDVGFQIPILITRFRPQLVLPRTSVYLEAGAQIHPSNLFSINDTPIADLIYRAAVSGELKIDGQKRVEGWLPRELQKPYFLRLQDGRQREVSDFSMSLTWETDYSFGHLQDLPSTRTLVDQIEGNAQILFRADDLVQCLSALTQVSSRFDVPPIQAAIAITAIASPAFAFNEGELHIKRIDGPGEIRARWNSKDDLTPT